MIKDSTRGPLDPDIELTVESYCSCYLIKIHSLIVPTKLHLRLFKVGLKIKHSTVKLVLSGHSKIYKTKDLKTDGSLIKVDGGAFCNTFGLH